MAENVTTEYEPGVLRVLQSKGETKAYYNKIAKVYDLLAEHAEREMREAGVNLLSVSPGEQLLEIGFGTGHNLAELAQAVRPNGKVHGIDLSENMVALTKNLLDRENLSEYAQLQCGDAEHLPYHSDTMDGIFMTFTLELFDTPEIPRVLTECKRVLRPGGRMVIVAISKEGKQGLISRAYEWTHRHFPNLMDCRPIFVRRALEAAGLVVESWMLKHMLGVRSKNRADA